MSERERERERSRAMGKGGSARDARVCERVWSGGESPRHEAVSGMLGGGGGGGHVAVCREKRGRYERPA